MIIEIIAFLTMLMALFPCFLIYNKQKIKSLLYLMMGLILFASWALFVILSLILFSAVFMILSSIAVTTGALCFFLFAEEIWKKNRLMEMLMLFFQGALIYSLLTNPVHFNGMYWVINPSSTFIGSVLYLITGLTILFAGLKMVRKSKDLQKKSIRIASFIFMANIIINIPLGIIINSLSITMPEFQSFYGTPLISLALLLVISIIINPYVVYLLPVKVEALYVLHASGIPVYSKKLTSKITHDPVLITGGFKGILEMIGAILGTSKTTAIIIENFTVEIATSDDFHAILVLNNTNEMVSKQLKKFIHAVAKTCKNKDAAFSDQMEEIITPLIKKELKILFELYLI